MFVQCIRWGAEVFGVTPVFSRIARILSERRTGPRPRQPLSAGRPSRFGKDSWLEVLVQVDARSALIVEDDSLLCLGPAPPEAPSPRHSVSECLLVRGKPHNSSCVIAVSSDCSPHGGGDQRESENGEQSVSDSKSDSTNPQRACSFCRLYAFCRSQVERPDQPCIPKARFGRPASRPMFTGRTLK